ncbi:serine/threonine-protein phosphatase 4 regulatory subunit 4-like [Anneissia japonica]|uniref:serine/threonine-protein phosphatase 4 regulatory subunit 4-like n=1 Tax=Anneissia japonica TaxID=1529436 RepID=UPI0014259C1A|nr:serine/threonine-protein phosphatase 4 regulatory subunit 4-like [Anneissia japonica]
MDWSAKEVAEIEENLADLSLERTITSSLKSAEEIERLTVDENLSDIQRAVFLLSSGQEVQRISVIKNLAVLITDNHDDAMRRVVPKVREVLHLASIELQQAAAVAFIKIAEEQIVSHTTYSQTFLQTILTNIDNRDPDISEAWLDVLLQVISFLPKDLIRKEILTVAVAKGRLTQLMQSRLASCLILGKIATRFDSFMIRKDLLPLVTSLCQDIEYEVRACMCRQLDAVARGLGLEPTKSAILPELVELSNDEESCVRLAALETIVNLLSLLDDGITKNAFFSQETCTQTIIPLVCKFCENAMVLEDATLPTVSRQFGKLCHGLSVNLNDEQKVWMMSFYCKLCVLGLGSKNKDNGRQSPPVLPIYTDQDRYIECRIASAYNFPCMVLFSGARSFKRELHGTFASLCDDPHPMVRATVANGFHEVAKLLGNNVSLIQGELINLLKDESIDVLQGLVSHLPETLQMFAKSSGNVVTESKVSGLSELIPALCEAELNVAQCRRWRLHVAMLEKLACLPKCLTSDQIYSKFIPVVTKHITTHRVLPVKRAAVRTTCIFMRYNRKQEQRQDICSKLIQACCRSKSCSYRMLFIDVCQDIMEFFSKAYFKENLYEFVLELAEDPVPNVRLKFCTLLPLLKSQMKLPKDRQMLQDLEYMARKLMLQENDIDVKSAIRNASFELDKIQVVMESVSHLPWSKSSKVSSSAGKKHSSSSSILPGPPPHHSSTKASKAGKSPGKVNHSNSTSASKSASSRGHKSPPHAENNNIESPSGNIRRRAGSEGMIVAPSALNRLRKVSDTTSSGVRRVASSSPVQGLPQRNSSASSVSSTGSRKSSHNASSTKSKKSSKT